MEDAVLMYEYQVCLFGDQAGTGSLGSFQMVKCWLDLREYDGVEWEDY